MEYEELMKNASELGIETIELNLGTDKECGKCLGNIIFINKNLNCIQKKCILAEEIGHAMTTTGNITDLSNISNMKQEELARRYGYRKLITMQDLIKMFKMGLRFDYEIAEELGVTIPFLHACVNYYKCRYETNKYLKEG